MLRLADVPKPTPRDREVLVRVHATTVTIGDTIMRSLNLPIHGWQKVMGRLILGWNKPRRRILGMELAGEIESVGKKVIRFKPGDPIFASTFAVNFGGHAEYKCLPESGVIAIKGTIQPCPPDFTRSVSSRTRKELRTMKAIVCTKYGPPDVLQLQEVEKPTPKDDEVLVKVHAASVNAYDWHLLTADIFLVRLMGGGLIRPKNAIPGVDIAGRIEAVGRNVKQFRPGDEVFGDISACGNGGFAEYVSVPENALALKPANLSFEEAAAVPMAALTALQGLRDQGKIQPGQKVLINGASGGVGTFAVQIAKSFGAEVTAVCSTRNLDMARTLGADQVIDYTKEDFTQSGQTV